MLIMRKGDSGSIYNIIYVILLLFFILKGFTVEKIFQNEMQSTSDSTLFIAYLKSRDSELMQ